MMFKTATAAIVVLAVTTALAQRPSPVAVPVGTPLTSQRQSLAGKSGISVADNKATGVPTPAPLRERVQDMEGTLAKMHAVLKQMRAKAASSSRDPLAKANLDMWELLVGHLDKQLRELQVAMITREDMESRRAAMYKQAEAKADAAAQAARALKASKAPTPVPAAEGAGQDAAEKIPTAAGETSAPPANAFPSPN
ncbi:MAG: hypothetical protein LAO56_05980 [Acidobacteriia bacterium]|nr:hypothetical protein [Terriglobia bacterium]